MPLQTRGPPESPCNRHQKGYNSWRTKRNWRSKSVWFLKFYWCHLKLWSMHLSTVICRCMDELHSVEAYLAKACFAVCTQHFLRDFKVSPEFLTLFSFLDDHICLEKDIVCRPIGFCCPPSGHTTIRFSLDVSIFLRKRYPCYRPGLFCSLCQLWKIKKTVTGNSLSR